MTEPITITKLPKSCMGFITKTGESFFIHEDDIKSITMQIILEGSLKKGYLIVKESDTSVEKANLLYAILSKEKDMKPELRNKYLNQIGKLLAAQSKTLINCSGEGEEMEFKEDDGTPASVPVF